MANFAVIVHQDIEGGFWGEVPALPGCYSQGEALAELRDNLREAIAGVLEVMKEQGKQRNPTYRFWTLRFEANPRFGSVPPLGGEWLEAAQDFRWLDHHSTVIS